MRRILLAIALVSLPLGALAAQSGPRRAFAPADWYKVTTLSSPAISPDGKWVAVTVTTVREAENKRHNEIWVVADDFGERQRCSSPGYVC
jgi:hypothetical protein